MEGLSVTGWRRGKWRRVVVVLERTSLLLQWPFCCLVWLCVLRRWGWGDSFFLGLLSPAGEK